MIELQLPPAPPLPAEVRERVLARVLAEIDLPQRRRRGPIVAVAAAVVTTLAVSASVALVGLGRTEIQPLLQPAPTEQSWPLPPESTNVVGQLDPYLLARCANAVQQSGHAGDYPPVAEWRATFTMGAGALEPEVIINDSFACLLTPAVVTVSPPVEVTKADLTIVEMSRGDLVVLNPKNRMVTIGVGQDTSRVIGGPSFPGGPREVERITFMMTFTGEKPSDMRVKVQDDPDSAVSYDGPVIDGPVDVVAPLVTFKDRPIPQRPDTPDGAALQKCMDTAPTHVLSAPELWTPVGRHEIPGFPKAVVARVGEVGVGFCLLDPPASVLPDFYRAFDGMLLRPLARPDTAQVVASGTQYFGTANGLLRLPPGVVRARMTVEAAGEDTKAAECTVMGEFAFCSLFMSTTTPGAQDARFTFTTFTSRDPSAPGTPVPGR